MQAEWQPECRQLYSLRGFQYCDLLLSLTGRERWAELSPFWAGNRERWQFREICLEVRMRARRALDWAEKGGLGLLIIALDHLSLGRSYLGLALTTSDPLTPGGEAEVEFGRSAEHLDHAVDGLRQAGSEDHLPHGLLARAAFRRLRGDWAAATADLDEALEIAERGSMRLFVCDAHLEWARLHLQQGETEAARGHVALARKLVNETGYGRREREVRWLESRFG
jgi:tetratricopeptide (TPR) repeat protein